ncbi:MAG: chorismate mutase [Dorea sp.]|nr:chorismate mutase [Dorea sp.]
MNDLEMYREQLALCDDKIIDALAERNRIIEKIVTYKEEYGMPIIQPRQDEKQNKRLSRKLAGNHYKEEIEDIFKGIHQNSKKIQAKKVFDYNLFFIGFMGCGKTTVSEYLRDYFHLNYMEMDQELARREGMSIPEIFASQGEQYFRDKETALIYELEGVKNTIVSCGGGAVLRKENVSSMRKSGKIILLTASPEELYQRLKDTTDRPLLRGRMSVEGIGELLEERRPRYDGAADLVIKTDGKSIQQIASEIVSKLTEFNMDE